MNYKVLNVINNNFLLLEDEDSQVIIMGKGIGFGKSKGEIIDIENEETQKNVFYVLRKNDSPNFNQLSHDLKEIEMVINDIVDIAKTKLGITNENLYLALLDHISFSIQRLRLGMPIENPFIEEIQILYREEFEVADYAAKQLSKKIGIDIGEAEKGFIALHLYSGRKNNPVNIAIKNVRLYKQAIKIINEYCNVNIKENTSSYKSFLLSLNCLLYAAEKDLKPEMALKAQIKLTLTQPYKIALKIDAIIGREMGFHLSEEILAFLALDIYKLKQI